MKNIKNNKKFKICIANFLLAITILGISFVLLVIHINDVTKHELKPLVKQFLVIEKEKCTVDNEKIDCKGEIDKIVKKRNIITANNSCYFTGEWKVKTNDYINTFPVINGICIYRGGPLKNIWNVQI